MNNLEPIIGRRLTSVTFVMDYIQLGFDGPCLTLLIDPVIIDKSTRVDSKVPGYRDGLCSQIAKTVVAANVIENVELTIDFDNHVRFIVSLAPDDYQGPEVALLSFGEGNFSVW